MAISFGNISTAELIYKFTRSGRAVKVLPPTPIFSQIIGRNEWVEKLRRERAAERTRQNRQDHATELAARARRERDAKRRAEWENEKEKVLEQLATGLGELWIGNIEAGEQEWAQARGFTGVVTTIYDDEVDETVGNPRRRTTWATKAELDEPDAICEWLTKKETSENDEARTTRQSSRAGAKPSTARTQGHTTACTQVLSTARSGTVATGFFTSRTAETGTSAMPQVTLADGRTVPAEVLPVPVKHDKVLPAHVLLTISVNEDDESDEEPGVHFADARRDLTLPAHPNSRTPSTTSPRKKVWNGEQREYRRVWKKLLPHVSRYTR